MEIKISKREQKRMETLNKLIDAMTSIIDKYDFDTLTIRNICSVSGVSYGSFYNLFDSKEKFLTYYLTNDFVDFEKTYYTNNDEFTLLNSIEKSIDIFVTCARYNVEKGLKFIRAFYSPKNFELSPFNQNENFFCFTPLVKEAKEYLKKAQEENILSRLIDIDIVIQEYCYLFNGCTFNWCIADGNLDIENDVKKRLTNYINSLEESQM